MTTNTPLSFANQQFVLNGKPLRIFSGAIHYFRVVPECWQDRMLKAKACGLNTVETYVPWNLHEPKPGVFKDDGILNIRRFVQMAGELGLNVILRPGPYICSEWDFGGLPSWLLADPEMKVRTNYPGYQQAVRRYFGWLLPHVADLQFSHGGPIIAVQVENEYGCFSDDPAHLSFVRDVLLEKGITELLVTSDNKCSSKTAPILDGVLPTANGQTLENVQATFEVIRKVNDQYPLMVMEFWSGWFDHWGYPHDARSVDIMVRTLEYVLVNKASFNLYMFFGGTNFGFMAGAENENTSSYKGVITSYDYDAPLAEDGRVTAKFWKIKEMLQPELEKIGVDVSKLPDVPNINNRASEPFKLRLEQTMDWPDLIRLVKKTASSQSPQNMESYSYENGDVQSYGYVVYRKGLKSTEGKQLVLNGAIRDRVSFLINGETQGEANWEVDNPTVSLPGVEGDLDIVVENLGRVNYTTKDRQDVLQQQQRKGFNGTVQLDGRALEGWHIFALDLCEDYVRAVSQSDKWTPLKKPNQNGPALYRASFSLPGEPADYFVRLDGWHKGVVIVNGFNLGRYWDIGPQRTLYLPGPILKRGGNQVIVFEERTASQEISFEIEPCLV